MKYLFSISVETLCTCQLLMYNYQLFFSNAAVGIKQFQNENPWYLKKLHFQTDLEHNGLFQPAMIVRVS